MKICLICEGCYPYVVGGVSSWVQMLISEFSDIEFCVHTIGVSTNDKGNFKCKIPENVVGIHETFLNTGVISSKKLSYRMGKKEKEAFESLLLEENVQWSVIFDFFRENNFKLNEFLMGRDFFDLAVKVYELRFSRTVFSDFLWTLRSMYLPIFAVLRNDIPGADLYHSVSTGYAGIIGSMAKHLYQRPFLLTEHGIYTREREEEIIKAEWTKGYFKDMWISHFYKLSRCAYDCADKVISLFSTNRELQIELGCPEYKTLIIPNGIRAGDYENLLQKHEDDCLNIGAIVRIAPIKDIKTMLAAFDIVKEEIPHAKFYIMGPEDEDIEYYDECRVLLSSLGTRDVFFTGKVDIKQYIGKMDILVLSSISEGQPIAVLEGMAAGKPWVVTNVGSCAELIEGTANDNCGSAGIVVPAMNVLRLAEAVIRLCRDDKMRKQMGDAGLNRVREHYTMDFLKLYRSIYMELGGKF